MRSVHVGVGVAIALLSLSLGYRIGSRRAFLRDKRAAAAPDASTAQPAQWVGVQSGAESETPAPAPAPPSGVIVIDAAAPLRITWPLDVGPEPAPTSGAAARVCLRARQGANEIQEPGAGVALHAFRLAQAATCKTWFRVRWATDGVADVKCNNSWFAGFDAQPPAVIGNETEERDWSWQAGPAVDLGAGVHWLRVELREDGPLMDTSGSSPKLQRYTGTIGRVQQACDADPRALAGLADAQELGLAGLATTAGKGAPAWRVVDDAACYDWTGAVDLRRVFGSGDAAFAYAVTWINAETALHHRSFTFQADDSGWLWVNGHAAVELPIDLPREANRLWTSVPLKKGANPVVIKLTQNRFYWGFRFDVVDWHWQGRRGDVITGVEPAAWPK